VILNQSHYFIFSPCILPINSHRTRCSIPLQCCFIYTKLSSSILMVSLLNLKVVIFSFLTSNTNHFLTNSATNTTVLYLFVPLRTQGICEMSPSGGTCIVWGTAWRIVCLWKAVVIDNVILYWDFII